MAAPNTLTTWSPYALAVLRIMTALLLIAHGTQKYLGFPAGPDGGSTVEVMSLMGLAGFLEMFGGLLILIGLFTRPAAFVLAGFAAAAYFIGHAPQNFYPALNGGDAAILFCFIFLYLIFAGPGAWSVDNVRGGETVRGAFGTVRPR